MASKLRWVAGAFVCVVLPGCNGATDAASNDNVPFVLSTDLLICDSPNGITVSSDRLEFPGDRAAMLKVAPGAFVVCDRQNTPSGGNPNGFLRRNKKVYQQGGKIVMETEQGYLNQIMRQGKFQYTIQTGAQVKSAPFGPGVGTQDVYQGPEIGFPDLDLASVELAKYEGKWPVKIKGQDVLLTVSAKAVGDLKGKMAFSPAVDIGFDIGDWKLKEFHTIFIGKSEISVTGSLAGKFSAGIGSPDGDPINPPEGSPLANLINGSTQEQRNEYLKMLKAASEGGSFKFSLFANTYQLPTVWLPTTPPIPVVTGLNVTLDLECPVEFTANITLTGGAKVNGDLQLGARYTNYSGEQAWTGINERTLSASPIGPDITGGAALTFGCSLKPSLGLIFYGLAGPYLWASGGAEVSLGVEQTCDGTASYPATSMFGKLTSKLEAGVGAKFGLFVGGVNIELASKELKLFDWSNDLVDVSKPLDWVKAGMCGNGCAIPPECTLDETKCTEAAKVQMCKADAGNCPVWQSQDCKTATSCFQDKQECMCGNPQECAIGDVSCVSPGQYFACEVDSFGCNKKVPHDCKTSDACFADPQKCATGGGSCTNSCGNGTCDCGETQSTCPADCTGSCTPNWTCAAWGTCGCANTQTRTCTDSNNCGTTSGKPATSQSCDPCTGKIAKYCGASTQFPGGCADNLYDCGSDGVTHSKTACSNGCHVSTPGVDDYCETTACGKYLDSCGACCTGYSCYAGICCHGPGTVGPGEPCGSGSDCCSGKCTSNICCANEVGTPNCAI
jgi:hypothetical protein